jgi:DNA-binding LytR/AlgR family response regulator
VSVTALIAEDEPLLREELAEHLSALWPELDVVARVGDGIAALRQLTELAPDVLLLDIRMPGMSGLEVARQAGRRCHVVFVTAFDQHAVAAFEQGAVDYVLKPVSLPRLATTVARLKERVTQPPADLSDLIARLQRQAIEGRAYLRWVNASVGTAIRLITVEEICYFRADRKYTLVATPGAESLIRKTIRELQGELDPTMFWQVHRATLVNVHAIAGVTRDVRGYLQVRLKQRPELLPVSETYAHLFRQM